MKSWLRLSLLFILLFAFPALSQVLGGPVIQPGGGAGSGTVNSGTAGQFATYATTGTAVSGSANLTFGSGTLTLGQDQDFFVYSNGDVGINTSGGNYPFEVNGLSQFDLGVNITGGTLSVTTNAALSGTTTFSGAINATGLSSGTVASNSYLGLNASNQVVLGAGGSGASPGGSGLNVQYRASSSTFGGATGLFVSTTRGGLDFLSAVTTANLLSLGDNGSDTTSYALGAGALAASTITGMANTAMGYQALAAVTSSRSENSVAVGYQALASANGSRVQTH